ncbi:MAG: hypothetical protein JNM56_37295 [Planctomycetia bacterium]|nr:hypothetical protein [Planctomycetia bacterium]
MNALRSTAPSLLPWLTATRARLAPLGLQPLPLDPDLAAALGGGRLRLRAARWQVGEPGLAECRTVHIVGASSEIANTLIFPERPERLPMFVADALITGGQARMVFVDLPAPGLDDDLHGPLARDTRDLAERWGRPIVDAPPDWAIEFSLGGSLFVRGCNGDEFAALTALHSDYLCRWREAARRAHAAPSAATARGADCLQRFKQGHLAHWPGTTYLERLFGHEWTHHFLHDFLYR